MGDTTGKSHKFLVEKLVLRCGSHDPKLRLLIGIVLTYCNADCDNAFPGNGQLATDMGVSQRTIKRHMQTLRETGWIVRTQSGGGNGEGRLADVLSVRVPHGVVTAMCDEDMARLLIDAGLVSYPELEGQGDSHVSPCFSESEGQGDKAVSPRGRGQGDKMEGARCQSSVTPSDHLHQITSKTSRSPEPTVTLEPDDGHGDTNLPESWEPNATHRRSADRAGIDVDAVAAEFRYRMDGQGRTDWDATFGAFIREAHAGRQDDVFPMRDPDEDHEPTPPTPADNELLPDTWQRPSWLTESDERVARYLAGHPDDDQLSRALAGYVAKCEGAGRDPVSGEFRLEVRRYVLEAEGA